MRLAARLGLAAGMAIGAAAAGTPASAGGNAEAGKAVFRKCMACHTATEPVNRVGPSLFGIVGRPVATAPGFSYSAPMTGFAEGGKVWDEALLSQYLLSPRTMVKGTAMAFPGLKKPDDIADVIAYLKDPAAAR